jgi:hypothetical protein
LSHDSTCSIVLECAKSFDTRMQAIIVGMFSPFDFFVVPSFPNVSPTMDELGDFLPIFRENEDDNNAQRLLDFHEYMLQLGALHEDVLMNMFMYSLEGDS